VKWCKDGDDDAYGSPYGSVMSCEAPGDSWIKDGTKARACEDCHDDNQYVHPFGSCNHSWYTKANGIGTSYDYDCDGQETECGQYQKFTDCTLNGSLQCVGSGYLPNSSRPSGASDPSIDPYCGSNQFVPGCQAIATLDGGISCVAQSPVQYNPITCK